MARTSKKTKTATGRWRIMPTSQAKPPAAVAANADAAAHGTELLIPLDKLKKSPRNARKTPHGEAEIEAYRELAWPAPFEPRAGFRLC